MAYMGPVENGAIVLDEPVAVNRGNYPLRSRIAIFKANRKT